MNYFIISLLPSLFYLFWKTKKSLHMLQQNWYNDDNRYLKWVATNKKKAFLNIEMLLTLAIVLSYKFHQLAMIIALVGYFGLSYVYLKKMKHEQSKKPLVITARIKRLILTIMVIYILPLILIFTLTEFKYSMLIIYYALINVLIYLNFILIWLANIINIPVEKQVFYHFKRQAVKKLKDMKNMKKIGITGSYGKTSSKNIITDILNVKFNATPTPKSFNTTYGLITSINNHLDKFTDIFVAEMGAFRIGEIKELCDLVKPDYGILTTIGVAHLETFGSRENIQKGKFELIESLGTNGVAILNMDDPYQQSYKLRNDCRIIWIAVDNDKADVIAKNIKLTEKGTTFDIKFKGDRELYHFETKLLGKPNIYNILAGIAVGRDFGLKINELQAGVKRVNSVEHRLELKKMGDITVIDDAYNSNPVGSKMALDVLNLMPGKKIVITPGMVDLGDEEDYYNKEFGKFIAEVADEVILIGKEKTKPIYEGLIEMKFKKEKIHVLNDVKVALNLIHQLKEKETFVLLENDLPDLFNE